MGKPNELYARYSTTLCRECTQGSKTFQYLVEKKLISISLVAASEKETAQTEFHSRDSLYVYRGSDVRGSKMRASPLW